MTTPSSQLDLGPLRTPAAKVRLPRAQGRTVVRSALIDTLTASDAQLVLVAAPAGFGKSTTVAQWCRAQGGPVAWAHLDASDGDPLVLMSTMIAAVRESGCVSAERPSRMDNLTADEPAFSRRVIPGVRASVERLPSGLTVVLDDVHDVMTPQSAAVVVAVADSLPAGVRMVLIGRSAPDHLPLERWRGQQRLLDVAPSDLAFDAEETAAAVACISDERLDAQAAEALVTQTGGWPVAVYLAAREPTSVPQSPRSGRSAHAYIASEVIASMDPDVADFLRRTSLLHELAAPLCDHVTGSTDAAQLLEAASRSSLMLSRLGDEDGWYRLHPLLRETLADELSEVAPERARAKHARASRWYDEHGLVEKALAHAARSGDPERCGLLLWRHGLPMLLVGRASTVQGWIDTATAELTASGAGAGSAGRSLTAAWTAMMQGRGADVVRWADDAEALYGTDAATGAACTDLGPSITTLLATRITEGHEQSVALAEAACRDLPRDHLLRPLAELVHGLAVMLGGDVRGARRLINHSALLSESMGVSTTQVEALSVRCIAELALGQLAAAAESLRLARVVWEESHLADAQATSMLMECADAGVRAASKDCVGAHAALERSARLVPAVEVALPWAPALRHALAARAYACLDDSAAGEAAVDAAVDAMSDLPPMPFLDELIAGVRRRLTLTAAASVLSPAERRVAVYIDSPLSTTDIAAEIGVSFETVKSHLGSIYRKLNVATRRDAADALRPRPHGAHREGVRSQALVSAP